MTSVRRIIIVSLLLVTIVVSSLVRTSEASRYHSDDVSRNSRHRHRHRHEATSVASSRRNHEALSSPRRSQWPQEDDDYEDALDVEDDDDEEDEDYDVEPRTRTLYERNYQPARNTQRNYNPRFEPRYPLRYHQTGHHPSPWYRAAGEEDTDRRRNSRYGGIGGGRGHRLRPGRDRTQHEDRRRGDTTTVGGYPSRSHEFEDPDEPTEPVVELDHDIGYDRTARRWRFDEDSNENSQDYRGTSSGATSRWRNSRRHRHFDHYDVTPESKVHRGRQEPRRNDWKPRISNSPASSGVTSSQRSEDDDWIDRRRKTSASHRKRPSRPLPIDDLEDDNHEDDRNESRGTWSNKKSRNNLIVHGFNDRRKENDLDYRDYDDDVAEDGDTRKSDKRRDELDKDEDEEESIWKEDEDNDDNDDDDQDFDNTNYYKSEDEPPYKTFDDIIKSLTSEDPTTSKPTIRRDYRNTGIEKYLKRDPYGNMYDPRNGAITTKPGNDIVNNGRTSNWTNNAATRWRLQTSKSDIASYPNVREGKKFSNSIGDSASFKANRDNERKRIRAKLDDPQPRTKSLEQDYDEDYDNNDKDEDVVKVADERAVGTQADVTNTEYADEENETETEGETSAPLATSSPATTTTSTTTTTTTTTTPKPFITTSTPRVTQERRDSRSYETSSAPQSNGLQQQQSVHGSHKWQSPTTREGSKESKGHLQPNNRNGKSEIKEARQHAIKVSREGSCQWPRARIIPVRDVYPSPSTTYIPHCAILHMCSDDTGCCGSEALTCVPKVSHRVELYFYTNSVGRPSVVEKLSFYNHTECECKERTERMASSDKMGVTNEHRLNKHQPTTVSPPQNFRRPPQRKPCKCPSEFTPRITAEGECQCNCYENDHNCIRTRRGKVYLSLRDRLCIHNDQCASPICEFGEYMRSKGRCPRKRDRFNAIANSPTNRFRS